jgi:hypothetical protein
MGTRSEVLIEDCEEWTCTSPGFSNRLGEAHGVRAKSLIYVRDVSLGASLGEVTAALLVDCTPDCAYFFVLAATLVVMDLSMRAAREGRQTHMDFLDELPCQGREPMPTRMSRATVKSARRRMG